MNKMKDESAVSDWLNEINECVNSGVYMGEDEVTYCQKKYDKALAAAQEYGGIEKLAAIMEVAIPEEKKTRINPEFQEWLTDLWRLVDLYQCCGYQDAPRYPFEELPRWSEAGWSEKELKLFAQADAYDTFMAEFFMLVKVISAASEHC
jgi:hypothetical protein